MKRKKVRITWNGPGGELDSVSVHDDGERAITDALIELVQHGLVLPGDSFTVEEE